MIKTIINNRTIIIQDSERQEYEIWTRVMGYYRPVSNFNIGKRQEHNDRKQFKEPVL